MDRQSAVTVPESLRYRDGLYKLERFPRAGAVTSIREKRIFTRPLRAIHRLWFNSTGAVLVKPAWGHVQRIPAMDSSVMLGRVDSSVKRCMTSAPSCSGSSQRAGGA